MGTLNVAVIGSGTMGPGIAQVFAGAGNDVTLVDVDEKALARGRETIARNLQFFVENEIASQTAADETLSRVSFSPDLAASVKAVDLAVEAVPERIELKRTIFEKMESSAPPDAVLASNTSSLRLTDIAQGTRYRSRVVGTHFLNPPQLVRIVEVVLGEETSTETAEEVVEILEACGKKPVIVKDVAGFVHNRLICALMREATYMAANDIASVEAIDTIVKEAFGPRFPEVGIFGLEDFVGLDILRDVSNQVFPTLDNSAAANQWLEQKITRGELGVKSGSGFYRWTPEEVDGTRKRLTKKFVEILRRAR